MGTLRIISHSNEPFRDRLEAGQLLARELKNLSKEKIVVLGIPRGGVVIAAELAHYLNAELDMVISRKLSAPGNQELAIGAISESGEIFIDNILAEYVGADETYIQDEKIHQMGEISKRKKLYRKIHPKVSLKEKIVIITDDGLATGSTMMSAVFAARKEKPKSIIAALPVGSIDSLKKLTEFADEVICLRSPEYFAAVGQFYLEFTQVTDKDVIEILNNYYLQNKLYGTKR